MIQFSRVLNIRLFFFHIMLLGFCMQICVAQKINPEKYPIDSSGLIAFSERVVIDSVSKEVLVKRLKKFLAFENWGRVVDIKCANGAFLKTIVVQDITFQDDEEGKIYGCGFFQMPYYQDKYFTLNFRYKIEVKDNKYRFSFSNFVYRKYMTADISKSQPFTIYTWSSKTEHSSGVFKDFPLEKLYLTRGFKRNQAEFEKNVSTMISTLKSFMDNIKEDDW